MNNLYSRKHARRTFRFRCCCCCYTVLLFRWWWWWWWRRRWFWKERRYIPLFQIVLTFLCNTWFWCWWSSSDRRTISGLCSFDRRRRCGSFDNRRMFWIGIWISIGIGIDISLRRRRTYIVITRRWDRTVLVVVIFFVVDVIRWSFLVADVERRLPLVLFLGNDNNKIIESTTWVRV